MSITQFQKIRPVSVLGIIKPVIAMLHLAALPGQPGYSSLDAVYDRASQDLEALQNGGIDAILVENWLEDRNTPETGVETAEGMLETIIRLKQSIGVPFGVNVLNNDYSQAFRIASATGASFVQLDVLVDHVISDFTYSQAGKVHPFEINVDLDDFHAARTRYRADGIPVFTFIQPKHYKMLQPDKPLSKSASQALAAGAEGLIITRATGEAPDLERIRTLKTSNPAVPVGIGSGFSRKNAHEFLPVADFAIVGSDLKIGGDVNNPVDPDAVSELMSIVRNLRNG